MRAECFVRDGGRCRRCQEPLELKSDDPMRLANIHEEPRRSLGGDATNRQQCLVVCAVCHDLITRHKVFLRVSEAKGTDGHVVFSSPGYPDIFSQPVIRDFKGASDDHRFEG